MAKSTCFLNSKTNLFLFEGGRSGTWVAIKNPLRPGSLDFHKHGYMGGWVEDREDTMAEWQRQAIRHQLGGTNAGQQGPGPRTGPNGHRLPEGGRDGSHQPGASHQLSISPWVGQPIGSAWGSSRDGGFTASAAAAAVNLVLGAQMGSELHLPGVPEPVEEIKLVGHGPRRNPCHFFRAKSKFYRNSIEILSKSIEILSKFDRNPIANIYRKSTDTRYR